MDIKARVHTDWSQPKRAAKEYTDEILQNLSRIDAAGKRAGSQGDVGSYREARTQAEQHGAAVEASRRSAVAAGAPQAVIDDLSSLAGLIRQSVEKMAAPFGNVGAALRSYEAAVINGANALDAQAKSTRANTTAEDTASKNARRSKEKAAKADEKRAQDDEKHAQSTRDRQRRATQRAKDEVTDPKLIKEREEQARYRQQKIQEDKRFKAEARDPEFEAETKAIGAKKSSEATGRYYEAVLSNKDDLRSAIAEAGVKAKRGEAALNAESARYRQRTPDQEAEEFVNIGTAEADKRRRKAAELAETERQTIPFLQQINRDTAEAEVLARRRKAALAAQINANLKGAPDILDAEARNLVDDRRNKARVAATAAKISDSDPIARQVEISDLATADAQKRRDQIARSLAYERRLSDHTEELAEQTAETEKLARDRKLATRKAVAATYSEGEAKKKAEVTVREQANSEREKLALLRAQIASYKTATSTNAAIAKSAKEELKVKNDILIESRRLRELEKQRIESAIRSGDINSGTRFQRIQQRLAARTGGPERLPEEFQNLQQFVASKAITSAGFALSGAVLYGGVQALREMVKEASELDKELQLIDALLVETGQGDQFDGLKKSLMELSKETGIAADQLAKVQRTLLGVFRLRDETQPLESQDQGPNVTASEEALAVASKFSAVTGVDPKLISNELIAIFSSYEDYEPTVSFQSLTDALVTLEDESSVAAEDLLKISGSLAPIVADLGIGSEELIRYSAAATQGSAMDSAAIADGLNRFLTELPSPAKMTEVLDIYQRSPELGTDAARNLQKLVAEGDMSEVIEQMIRDYQKLSPELKQAFKLNVMGKRDAKAVVGLFENPTLALRDVDTAGGLDQRWEKVRDTLINSVERMRAAFEELGNALFEAGLGDVMKNLAIVVGGAVEALTKLLGVLILANEKLGGVVTQGIGAFGAVALLQAGGRRGRRYFDARRSASRAATTAAGDVAESGLWLPSGAMDEPLPPDTTRRGRAKNFVKNNAGLIGPALMLVGVNAFMEARAAEQESANQLVTQIGSLSDEDLQRGLEMGGDSNWQKLMNTFSGGKTTEQYYKDELQRREGPGNATILTSLTSNEYADAVENADLPQEMKDALATSEGRNKLRGELMSGTTDDTTVKAYEEIISAYLDQGNVSQEYRDAVTEGGVKTDAINKGIEAGDSLEDASKKVDLAIEALKSGDETYANVQAAIATRTEKLQAMVDGAIAAGKPDPALEKLLAESKAQGESTADLAFSSYAEMAKQISELRGDTGRFGNEKAMEIDRFLLSDFGTGISQELRTSTAVDLATRQKTALEFEISQAQSVSEAIQAYKDSLANYDPVARFELLKAQLAGPLFSTQVALQGGDLDEVTEEIQGYLDEGVDESIAAIQSELEDLNSTNLNGIYDDIIARKQALLQILLGIEDPAAFSKDLEAQAAMQGYQQASTGINANLSLANSTSTNSVTQAENAKQAASDILDQARIMDAQVNTVESANAVIAAEAAFNESIKQLDKAHDAIATTALAIDAARAAGDPVASARVAQQQANLAMQQARGDQALINQATAQGIAANKAMEDASNDIQRAQLELQGVQVAGDPIAAAQVQLDLANFNVNAAKGEAEKIRALAAQISAKRALSEAIGEVMSAFYDIAIATREAAGDAIGAAELQLERINKLLAGARERGDKTTELQLLAEKVRAEAQLRDTKLGEKTSDIDFALQMEQITTGQAIQELELLLKIPGLTKQQIQELQLKIKSLRDGAGLSQFNTPSEINLPTIYEVRRLDQLNGGTYQSARTGYDGGMSNSNNDNRQINIVINAKNTVEAEAALKVVKDSLGSAPRTGVDYKLY